MHSTRPILPELLPSSVPVHRHGQRGVPRRAARPGARGRAGGAARGGAPAAGGAGRLRPVHGGRAAGAARAH